jgi:glutamate-1-semialdehyde 2,1-aminomutase
MMTSTSNSCIKDVDRSFFDRELASFLPDRIFDAHTHLWRSECVPWSINGGSHNVGYEEYVGLMQDIHPGRVTKALFLPAFSEDKKDQIQVANEWNARQTAVDADCRGLFFIKPEDDPEWIRQEVKRLGLHGLKCYHTMAPVKPTWEADIPDYLPEAAVKVAHEEGWVITLHMVKSRAAADPVNIHWIRHYCETYPDMKLILAHSARGFQPAHNLEGLPKLTGLDNLYFDTSVNCEPIAHQAIIRFMGHKKMMYGSDLPASHARGRSLGAADSFIWLHEDSPIWGEKHLDMQPVLVGLEHLRSIKWACWSERLSENAIEDIFWNNAAELLGV